MTTERDCKHGQLARSCNVCELEAEVARQTAEIERLKAACAKEFDSVQELDCKLGVANALLRQALEAMRDLDGYRHDIDAAIAAIKTHLGEV